MTPEEEIRDAAARVRDTELRLLRERIDLAALKIDDPEALALMRDMVRFLAPHSLPVRSKTNKTRISRPPTPRP